MRPRGTAAAVESGDQTWTIADGTTTAASVGESHSGRVTWAGPRPHPPSSLASRCASRVSRRRCRSLIGWMVCAFCSMAPFSRRYCAIVRTGQGRGHVEERKSAGREPRDDRCCPRRDLLGASAATWPKSVRISAKASSSPGMSLASCPTNASNGANASSCGGHVLPAQLVQV